MNNQLKKNISVYNLNIILRTIAISMPHAILTVLLLDKGLSLSQIALIQAMYSLAVVLFEFPSGVLSDLYSRKLVYLLSLVSLGGSYFFIIFSDNVFLLCLAWFIYGISSALDSGTLDAHIISSIKSNKDMTFLQKFIKNMNQLALIAAIIGASIGSFLYFSVGINMYWISIGLLIVVFIIVLRFFDANDKEEENIPKNVSIKGHIHESLNELKTNKSLLLFMLLLAMGQFFIQPHFQLWQALFLVKDVGEKYFFIIYILFQIVQILSYYVDIKNKTPKKMYIMLALGIGLLLIIKPLEGVFTFILVYLLMCYIVFVVNYYITYSFNKIVPKEKIASLSAISSTITRIFSFIILIISSVLLDVVPVESYFIINFGIMFCSSIVLLLILQKNLKASAKMAAMGADENIILTEQ